MAGTHSWNARKIEMKQELQANGKWKEFVRLRGTLQASGVPVKESYEQAYATVMAAKAEPETAFTWGGDT